MSASRDEVFNAIHRMSYPVYAEKFLKIRTKTEGVQPFRMNVGQLFLHRKCELQMMRNGFVRVVLVKARQWGGSTYIQGRSYHKIAAKGAKGMRSYILTHSDDATTNIFGMTRRFHQGVDVRIRPAAQDSGARLVFPPPIDSSYAVATARTKAVGRSDTIQFFHGSEVAYWPNAEDHLGGALQAVPAKGPDTEVFLESTGHGIGNPFHQQYTYARAGLGDYEAVFVPWAWFPHKDNGEREYSAEVRNLELTGDDEDYMALWGLTEEQMQFRQDKVVDFGGGDTGRVKFATEYPMTPEEAFSMAVAGAYIDSKYVVLAKRQLPHMASRFGPKIMGIDPNAGGDDRFVVMMRHGRYAWRVGRWKGGRPRVSVNRVKELVEREKPDVITMDTGGQQGILFDWLAGMVSSDIQMIPVMGGESADDDRRWRNKRAETWGRMRDWFEDPITPCIDDKTATDDDEREVGLEEIQGDLTNVLTDWDNQGRPTVENKKKVLSHAPSPDNAEALATTFTARFGPDWKRQSHEDAMEHARRKTNWRAN